MIKYSIELVYNDVIVSNPHFPQQLAGTRATVYTTERWLLS